MKAERVSIIRQDRVDDVEHTPEQNAQLQAAAEQLGQDAAAIYNEENLPHSAERMNQCWHTVIDRFNNQHGPLVARLDSFETSGEDGQNVHVVSGLEMRFRAVN